MAVKGSIKADVALQDFTKSVGFAQFNVVAVNPSRDELNKLLGKENKEDDKEIEYLSEDDDGNKRVRLTFWLKDPKTDKLDTHSILLTNKERTNKDGDNFMFVNQVMDTWWADDEANLPDYFTNFIDKKTKQVKGEKRVRKAIMGEDDFGMFVKAWLNRIGYNDPAADLAFDYKKLFKGNVKELRDLIGSEFTLDKVGNPSPFIGLMGVRTDKNGKQYQQIFPKAFLPGDYMKYINMGFKFPDDYKRNVYARFLKAVESPDNPDYAFSAYYELCPRTDYDVEKDMAASDETHEPTETGSDF